MRYRELVARLRKAGIDSAEWDTALLLEHFCGAEPARLTGEPEKEYTGAALENAFLRREARYPLQYLLGEWQFWRQTYEVTPDCLIPRADTECLVEQAIRLLPPGASFADLCTGSGCIAVSVLADRPDTRATAVDVFPATLETAVRNASRNHVAERFYAVLADVLSPDLSLPDAPYDAILCNPPYIPTATVGTLDPELTAEPAAALDGGEDGLLFYRAILKKAERLLKPSGFFLFEIGWDQADALRCLGAEAGCTDFRCVRDYGGNDRVVYLRQP